MSLVSDFVATFLPQAQSVSAQTGLPVDYVLGQAGLESAWGTSRLAQQQNNYFGIGGAGNYASYADPSAGFNAYAALINSPRYAGVPTGGSAADIAGYLNAHGYSETPDYAARVAGATGQVDQALAAAGVSGGVVAGPGGTASSSAASAGPSGWLSAIGGAATNLAARAGVFVLAIILLLGAIALFALRTAHETEAPA